MSARICIYGNCQALGVSHFMRKARPDLIVESFQNYQIILGEQTVEALVASASKCNVFVYQPVDNKHGHFSTDYFIRSIIPPTAKTVSFPYILSYGMFPLIGHGDGVIGMDDIKDILSSKSKAECLAQYDANEFDFRLWSRHLACAAEQARREDDCDVKMTKWMMNYSDHRLLLTYNHPSSLTFVQLAARVMEAAGLDWKEINHGGDNDVNLPCTEPVSRYVIDEFGWNVEPDASAHAHYRELLALAWEKAHKSV